MQRKFITNLILLVALNFLIKPFWVFGIDTTVQNRVGADEYGFYFAIFNLAFILQMVLDMGITNFNSRNIARHNQLLSKHFSGLLMLRLTFAVIYLIMILFIGYSIGYTSRQMHLLLIIGLNQFLLTFILYLRSNISALLLFKTDSLLSVLDRLFMILICGVLLWGNLPQFHFSIEAFVYSQTASYLLTVIIAFAVVVRKTSYLKIHWNYSFYVFIIKKSFPFALLVLLMGMYSRIDSFLIERILSDGANQAGIFASAFRLMDVANNMSGVLMASLLLPIFSKMIKQKKDLSSMVKLPFTILLILSVSVAALTLFYSYEIVTLLYHQHPDESATEYLLRMDTTSKVLIYLMFAYIASSTTYVFGTLLTANGSLRLLNKVAASGVFISLILNFGLIPVLKSEGSAIAALSAQWFTAIIQLYFGFKLLKIRIEKLFYTKIALFISSVFALVWISTILPFDNYISIIIACLSIATSGYLLGLINISAFLAIIKKTEN